MSGKKVCQEWRLATMWQTISSKEYKTFIQLTFNPDHPKSWHNVSHICKMLDDFVGAQWKIHRGKLGGQILGCSHFVCQPHKWKVVEKIGMRYMHQQLIM